MNDAYLGLLGVLVGAVVTAVVSIGGELLRGWQASQLDSSKRRDDRHIEVERIQRANSLELQEALTEFLRAESNVSFADIKALRTNGKLTPLPDGLSEAGAESTRRLMYLTERVTAISCEPLWRISARWRQTQRSQRS